MPDWRDEYLASLREAEQDNPVNHELIQACSQLQDRIAVLEAEKAALQETGAGAAAGAPPVPASSRRDAAAAAAAAAAGPAAASDPSVARLRLDLAEALRAQGLLQSRVKTAEGELQRLRSKTADDSRAIRQLTSERNVLATKVRDRDEELRGKSKLVENVQDELLALTLQLNVTEQKKAKIEAENKELVERWMKRKGQEAEALNLANEPLFTRRQ
ncbi:hypothetical protein GGTG_01066 [Gaeumannomyces tritici R3-111a-1]|uniref:Autophagy-related protein 16 domain-containing protein n=1 Tax=Gaeumannomyces tritici (strain R3-111a-1) TaxID=644352 RepID=J3NII6_GAET3|nr:hypothetical protein GGTG_01066 [Gaeumannomyces tritici R3-111a-1]EJT81079.1 hypothetical protein GGTG_01066 [Gaeumannomyces tritici R3-111a-1]